MKLELKHLAPYLPYGLKVKRTTEETEEILILTAGKLLLWEDGYYTDFKPLLLPLSVYAKEHAISYGYKDWEFISIVASGAIESRIIDDLYRDKVDVFNLIPAGLALNKLDYENNKA